METTIDVKRAALALLRRKGLIPKEEVTFSRGRCSAHKYVLNIQGRKKWATYQCVRENCHHFATLDNIRTRRAECFDCGEQFLVQTEHVIKDSRATILEEMLNERLSCGCNIQELEGEILERLKLELEKEKKDDLNWLEKETK